MVMVKARGEKKLSVTNVTNDGKWKYSGLALDCPKLQLGLIASRF